MDNKVIVRIKGGLGNQMFCYAAARRLSIVSDAELVIDDVTGFVRDRTFKRRYMLDGFNIPVRKATPRERLEPFEPYRRRIMRYLSRPKPFKNRRYLEQQGFDFDERLLDLRVKGAIHLDGYWQSERYFQDCKSLLASELVLPRPKMYNFLSMAEQMKKSNSIAVGVRLYEEVPASCKTLRVTPFSFYNDAAKLIAGKIQEPVFFVFCTRYKGLDEKLQLPGKTHYVTHDTGYDGALENLWLISQCRHQIISNSSFYWWGAWLSQVNRMDNYVVACDLFPGTGTIPERWTKLST